MQKRILLLVLFCVSSQSVCMHKADTHNKSFVKEVFNMPVLKKARLDDNEDLMPPDCFKIIGEPEDLGYVDQEAKKAHLLSRSSSLDFDKALKDNDFLVWPDLFAEGDFSDQGAFITSLFYVMFFNHGDNTIRTLTADSKNELLKQCVIYYVQEVGTESDQSAQAHLYAKVSYMPIFDVQSHYAIKCNALGGHCKHIEYSYSKRLLVVQLFAHYVVEHGQSALWKASIEQHISGSLEEAMAKLWGT